MTADERLAVAIPNAPTSELKASLRIATRALSRLATSQSDLARIESLRRDVLTTKIKSSPSTIPLRVWFSILCDLASQGWQLRVLRDQVQLCVPKKAGSDVMAEKARVRSGHMIERDRYLGEEPVRRFVREMESSRIHKGRWTSVFSLMRDGRGLAGDLEAARQHGLSTLQATIDPYLQVADTDSVCELTGLRLIDIWRYFRLTWSTIPQSVPGRRMLILVRDRAAENHPVIGVAALGSAVVQLGVRDRWIGWTAEELIEQMRAAPSKTYAAWVIDAISDAINDIYCRDLVRDGLVSAKTIANPTPEVISRLRKEALRARQAHVRYGVSASHKEATQRPHDADWKEQAKTFLYRSKRSIALAAALESRLTLLNLGLSRPSKEGLVELLASSAGRKAISTVLRYVKAKHVGIDIADITVCGAVAPYTHV